jgi:L-asparaginase II
MRWEPAVVQTRGDFVETLHHGGAIAVDSTDATLFELGESGSEETFFRSAAKIWQAQVMIESRAHERFHFTDAQIALACSSHNGEARHTGLAKQMLDQIGLPVSALLCGTHQPYCETLAPGEVACALHNNCSGKHAGMLAACVMQGWPLETYQHHDHPLQEAIRKHIRKAAKLPEDHVLKYAIDGCGVPSYCMTMRQMATAYSTLGTDYPETRRCVAANSWCIAGAGEFDTLVPEITAGRIVTKRGGGALLCLNTGNVGIVVKVADGTSKCKEPMMMRVLQKLNLLSESETQQLQGFAKRQLRNVAGTVIGVEEVIF